MELAARTRREAGERRGRIPRQTLRRTPVVSPAAVPAEFVVVNLLVDGRADEDVVVEPERGAADRAACLAVDLDARMALFMMAKEEDEERRRRREMRRII